ncbi:hypothetical protein AB7V82_09880 [Providencia stuartii]|uniref:hypothetical protein n=1 Tax=Providencia TaxID=586 RepID=UPI00234A341B|nr:hypothetical protein [Providencia sp. PROV148]
MAFYTMTNFADRISFMKDGQYVGSAMPNVFGGYNFSDAAGQTLGHTSTFDNTEIFHGDMGRLDGFARPNVSGGVDYFSSTGSLQAMSIPDFQGVTLHDVVDGSSEHISVISDNLSDDHVDGLSSFFHKFLG